MLRQDLINNDFQTIYFNAWENDFVDDALTTLIGEIELGLNQLNVEKNQKSKLNKTFSKVKGFGSYLIKRSAPVALSSLTAGIVNSEAVTEVIESIASEQINNYERAKNSFNNFKSTLKELVDIVKKNNDKPVVFFIDELDRCRPNFAIEVLEKAKHLFSVPGMVFVIAIDKEQLGHSIRSVYGQNMDVDGYLRRFLDFDYQLPKADAANYSSFLFNRYELSEYFSRRQIENANNTEEIFSDIFGRFSNIFGFSLRKQEQCFSLLSLALLTTPLNQKIFPHFLIFLLILKSANSSLYRSYVEGFSNSDDVINFIKNAQGGAQLLNEHIGVVLEGYLIVGPNDRGNISRYINHYELISNDDAVDKDTRDRARNLLDMIRHIRNETQVNIVHYISRKLDILDAFVDETRKTE